MDVMTILDNFNFRIKKNWTGLVFDLDPSQGINYISNK